MKIYKAVLKYSTIKRYDTGPWDDSTWWNECNYCGNRKKVSLKTLYDNNIKDIKHYKDCPYILAKRKKRKNES